MRLSERKHPILQQRQFWLPLLVVLLLFVAAGPVVTEDTFVLDRELVKQVERKYGKEAVGRLTAWEEIIRQSRNLPEREKLARVNHFFNSRIRFANDIDVWNVQDYWATPVEFLVRGAGDCEDFAIAKYFTLRALGVVDEKLKITYVKALQYNIHHMVLSYYSDPNAEPLVLDNLIDSIVVAGKRNDLLPIFSFNGSGLWLAKQRGQGQSAGSSSRLRLWQDLQKRMAENKL